MKLLLVTGSVIKIGKYESFYKYKNYYLYYGHDGNLLGVKYTNELVKNSKKDENFLLTLFATFPQTTLDYIKQFPPKQKMLEEYSLKK